MRRLPAVLGVAAVAVGIVLLAAVAGAFAVSRCGGGEDEGGGEAHRADQAMVLDANAEHSRVMPPARPPRSERAARPVRLQIPAIGVSAPIIRLGLNPDRSLEVPKDFGDTGWWTGGPRPGERGPAVIAGHVDSKTGPAVFYRIRDLRPGDAVVIDRRDGSHARFVVTSSAQYPKDNFPTARVYGRTSGPTLRLITCSGTFDRSTGHYLDNTVVYAVAA